MSLYIPSFSEILAVSHSGGALSAARNRHRGLRGWWPMQAGGGTTAFDASGWGNDATLSTPAWTVGEIGRDLTFNGTSDSGTIPSCLTGARELSVSFWLWFTGARDGDIIFEHSTNYNLNAGSFIAYLDSNLLYVGRKTSTGWNNGSAAEPSEGVWNHITVLYRWGFSGAQAQRLFYNAVEQEITSDNTQAVNTTVGDHSMYLGARGGSSLYLACRLANFKVYDRILTDSEIAQEYADPWGMGRLEQGVFPVAPVAGGVSITINMGPGLTSGPLIEISP